MREYRRRQREAAPAIVEFPAILGGVLTDHDDPMEEYAELVAVVRYIAFAFGRVAAKLPEAEGTHALTIAGMIDASFTG